MICFTCSMQFLSLTILSEHDHRAIAAAFVHRQNGTFRVSDFKIDIHAAARSVGERNITLDAVMLQRFTQHNLQIHCIALSLSELMSHNPLATIGRSSRHPTAKSTSPVD